MSEHTKFAETAERLIAKHGRTLTFTKPNGEKQWVDETKKHLGHRPAAPATTDVKGLVLEYADKPEYADKIERKIKRLLVAATADFSLLEYESMIDSDGIVYGVSNVRVLKPGDQAILYKGEVQAT